MHSLGTFAFQNVHWQNMNLQYVVCVISSTFENGQTHYQNVPMAKGGWHPPPPPPPNKFFQFLLRMRRAFIPNKIFSCRLILGTFVHGKTFQIESTILALKLDEKRVLQRDGNHPPPPPPPWTFFTCFPNHEDDIQS